MYFTKNEIIELKDGNKYIVVDIVEDNGAIYYYVCQVDKEEKNIRENFKVITTVKKNGYLFVKTIEGELESELITTFKERLNIS